MQREPTSASSAQLDSAEMEDATNAWVEQQAVFGVLRQSVDKWLTRTVDRIDDVGVSDDLEHALGLSGRDTITPFQVFSPQYLMAYRGSRDAKVLPKKKLLMAARRSGLANQEADLRQALQFKAIELGTTPKSRQAVLSSWDPFALDESLPGLEAKPVAWFQLQWTQAIVLDLTATMDVLNRQGDQSFQLQVVDEQGQGIGDAKVTLLYDRRLRTGVERVTDAQGLATLTVPAGQTEIDAILIAPQHSYWSFAKLKWRVPANSHVQTLKSLGQAHQNQFKYLGPPDPNAGRGVRCAIVDSGVGPHPALTVKDGANLVIPSDEYPADVGSHLDNGTGHGTHVAGIIAAQNPTNDPGRPTGIAPATEIYAYRVTARLAREAPSYAIADAIDAAIKKDCHLINISLGLDQMSVDVEQAVERAYQSGAVVIAAIGNAPQSPIMFPASSPRAIGVAALGDLSRAVADSQSALSVRQPPRGSHPDDFVANFNSRGPGAKAAAPGVAIISCAPHGQFYAAQDGTSMATPVVTGIAAKLLATRPDILIMNGQTRADAISALILNACNTLGFLKEDVGHGHPIA